MLPLHTTLPYPPTDLQGSVIGMEPGVIAKEPSGQNTAPFSKCSLALTISTSSNFLHFFNTRIQTGIPVEKKRVTGKPITLSILLSFKSLVLMRSSAQSENKWPNRNPFYRLAFNVRVFFPPLNLLDSHLKHKSFKKRFFGFTSAPHFL